MQIKAQVISERTDEYTGKRGPVKQQVLSLLDMDEANRFVNTFDYIMGREEADKYTGKLSGKVIELGVHSFEAMFNGRLRARGRIVTL
ncbi:MAG: hypothetical protein WCS70_05260 [Verrucomicrobiota bacterium]